MKDPIASAVASEKNNGRVPMGTSATGWKDKTTSVANGKLVASKNSKADPLGMTGGATVRRRGTCADAQHRITAVLPGPSGEAAATQANGKILPPTHSQSGNFWGSQFDGRV
jgi:hypothetical protein